MLILALILAGLLVLDRGPKPKLPLRDVARLNRPRKAAAAGAGGGCCCGGGSFGLEEDFLDFDFDFRFWGGTSVTPWARSSLSSLTMVES